MEPYFVYGQTEIDYLSHADKRLAAVIERIGPLRRRVIPDLFSALVHSIVGQQISTKAHETIWSRFTTRFGDLTPEALLAAGPTDIQVLGISHRKADYILEAATRVANGSFRIDALAELPDDEVCKALCTLKGIGPWSAEMLMLFSMQRPNVLSFGDLGIVRGLRMVCRHRVVTRPLFEKYRRRFAPYCSVASLYLWEVAGGAIPELTDPAPRKKAAP